MLSTLKKNKTLVSKFNTIGAVRQNVSKDVSVGKDKINAETDKPVGCSEMSDNKTTYVLKKEWVAALKDYLFPPYVECDYVL